MTKTTYRNLPGHIALLEPYEHGSSSAVNNLNREYVVTSYNTPIARAVLTDHGWVCRLNPAKYSVTTSRLQNIIREVWPNVIETPDLY